MRTAVWDGHMEGAADSGTLKNFNITTKLLAAVHEAWTPLLRAWVAEHHELKLHI